MPRAFSEAEKESIMARLLAVGQRLFTSHGLRKVTVEELAAEAAISKGAFYLFYPSKEALFMAVMEQAEQEFRQTVLAAVDAAVGTPRARLYQVLHTAFTTWKTIPLLQVLTRGEYDGLARRIPAEQLQAHLQSDQGFVEELLARCRAAGIPVQVEAAAFDGLLHLLFFTSLHEDDLGPGALTPALETLLGLVAAYGVGEVSALVPEVVQHESRTLRQAAHRRTRK